MPNFEASKTLFLKAFRSLKNGLDSSTITKPRFPRSRVVFWTVGLFSSAVLRTSWFVPAQGYHLRHGDLLDAGPEQLLRVPHLACMQPARPSQGIQPLLVAPCG